jgi:hypothetical protein
MKNTLLAFALLICGCLPLCAQQTGEAQNRIRSIRIAYISDYLKLTPEESQKFWPVYNQYEAEQKKLRQKYRAEQDINGLSDQEVERSLLDGFELEEQMIKIKRDYFQKFKAVIPVRKIYLLTRAEKEFTKELLRRMQEKKD